MRYINLRLTYLLTKGKNNVKHELHRHCVTCLQQYSIWMYSISHCWSFVITFLKRNNHNQTLLFSCTVHSVETSRRTLSMQPYMSRIIYRHKKQCSYLRRNSSTVKKQHNSIGQWVQKWLSPSTDPVLLQRTELYFTFVIWQYEHDNMTIWSVIWVGM